LTAGAHGCTAPRPKMIGPRSRRAANMLSDHIARRVGSVKEKLGTKTRGAMPLLQVLSAKGLGDLSWRRVLPRRSVPPLPFGACLCPQALALGVPRFRLPWAASALLAVSPYIFKASAFSRSGQSVVFAASTVVLAHQMVTPATASERRRRVTTVPNRSLRITRVVFLRVLGVFMRYRVGQVLLVVLLALRCDLGPTRPLALLVGQVVPRARHGEDRGLDSAGRSG
jgi:hypothetical protein